MEHLGRAGSLARSEGQSDSWSLTLQFNGLRAIHFVNNYGSLTTYKALFSSVGLQREQGRDSFLLQNLLRAREADNQQQIDVYFAEGWSLQEDREDILMENDSRRWGSALARDTREGLAEKVTFELRPG